VRKYVKPPEGTQGEVEIWFLGDAEPDAVTGAARPRSP
jgi:hypothetical protein